jgi:hypothetical protein
MGFLIDTMRISLTERTPYRASARGAAIERRVVQTKGKVPLPS